MESIKSMVAIICGFSTLAFVIICIAFALGAVFWPYTINTWLAYSGKPPYVEWWMGGLMGLVPGLGQSCLPASLITFIIMLFIGW